VKRYRVRVAREARDDLLRLVRFFSESDPASAKQAARVLASAFSSLATLPFASRVAAAPRPDPSLRELLVPFGRAGYVVLFRVTDERTVSVLAVRHQRKADYY
jgi:plasmid stabilization system protein ParE